MVVGRANLLFSVRFDARHGITRRVSLKGQTIFGGKAKHRYVKTFHVRRKAIRCRADGHANLERGEIGKVVKDAFLTKDGNVRLKVDHRQILCAVKGAASDFVDVKGAAHRDVGALCAGGIRHKRRFINVAIRQFALDSIQDANRSVAVFCGADECGVFFMHVDVLQRQARDERPVADDGNVLADRYVLQILIAVERADGNLGDAVRDRIRRCGVLGGIEDQFGEIVTLLSEQHAVVKGKVRIVVFKNDVGQADAAAERAAAKGRHRTRKRQTDDLRVVLKRVVPNGGNRISVLHECRHVKIVVIVQAEMILDADDRRGQSIILILKAVLTVVKIGQIVNVADLIFKQSRKVNVQARAILSEVNGQVFKTGECVCFGRKIPFEEHFSESIGLLKGVVGDAFHFGTDHDTPQIAAAESATLDPRHVVTDPDAAERQIIERAVGITVRRDVEDVVDDKDIIAAAQEIDLRVDAYVVVRPFADFLIVLFVFIVRGCRLIRLIVDDLHVILAFDKVFRI